MLNYVTAKPAELNTNARVIDAITDIKTDVRGASFALYASAEGGLSIEPEQLHLIADALFLASEALGGVIKQLGNDAPVMPPEDEQIGMMPNGNGGGLKMGLVHRNRDNLYEIDCSEVPGAIYQGKIQFSALDDALRYLSAFDENQREGARIFFDADESGHDLAGSER